MDHFCPLACFLLNYIPFNGIVSSIMMDLVGSSCEERLVLLLSMLLEELLSLVSMENMFPKSTLAPEGLWKMTGSCFAGDCTISTCSMACICWSMACLTSPLVNLKAWHTIPCLFYLSGSPGYVTRNGVFWYSLAPSKIVWVLCDSEKCHSILTKQCLLQS